MRIVGEAPTMLGGLCLPAKEFISVLERSKASDGFKQRGHIIRPTQGGECIACWDSLENSGEGSSLLREKGCQRVLTFPVMACK